MNSDIDKAYREALLDWDFHKRDCPFCGSFGVPGCDFGEPIWNQLVAVSRERQEQLTVSVKQEEDTSND